MKEIREIKECFVAFIDLLGFKDMISMDAGSGKYLEIIQNAIKKGTEGIENRKKELNHPFEFWYNEFKVKSFSDCFCFSIPLEFDDGEKDFMQNFIAFYTWLMVFYNELLNEGFLCRGGITQGWHHSSENIIFSKALIDAYHIESKEAVHPIIMIDEKLLSQLKNKGFQNERFYKYMFSHDIAGRNFLNQFNYSIVDEMFFGFLKDESQLEKEKENRKILLSKYLVDIDRKIIENKGKVHVDKYQWIKEFIGFTLENKYSDKFREGLSIE